MKRKILLWLLFLSIISLGIIANELIKDKKEPERCKEKVYYFFDGEKYTKADSQKFLIMFTGEIANGYFKVGEKEYTTKQYYKEFIDCTK